MKNTLLFIYSTNILVRLLTVNMKNCLTQKNPNMCDPILVTLLKMRPHYSPSNRENATPSSGTSPLASYKEVPSPPPLGGIWYFFPFLKAQAYHPLSVMRTVFANRWIRNYWMRLIYPASKLSGARAILLQVKQVMASFRCSDVNEILIITNFHLYLINCDYNFTKSLFMTT